MYVDVIDYRCYSIRNTIPFQSRHPVYCNAAHKSRLATFRVLVLRKLKAYARECYEILWELSTRPHG